jgi:Ulp1 family protease
LANIWTRSSEFYSGKSRVKHPTVPQKVNADDCGVHLINNALEFLTNPGEDIHAYSKRLNRQDIKKMTTALYRK